MPKLLIIDDEADIREYAVNYFKRRGVEMFTAASGREGLEIISSVNPDLVLLDMRMEGMNGIEVLQEMRAKNLQTKVILVTGVEETEAIEKSRALGITDLVHKPFNLGDLEKVVMRELGANLKQPA